MSDYQCIELSNRNRVAVVRLLDEKVVDPERIQLLGQELLSLAHGESQNLLINMDNVRFLSSSAINNLIVLERRVSGSGGEVKLSNLSPEVAEVFNITQLNSVFDICESEDEALGSFKNGAG